MVIQNALKGKYKMAKCENCGKTTTFGHNRTFSKRATNRSYLPNLQKVTVLINGKRVKKDFVCQMHPDSCKEQLISN